MVYEMVFGALIFRPKKDEKKQRWGKNDDHLALFMECFGEPTAEDLVVLKKSKRYNKFFTPEGKLHRIKELKSYPLMEMMMEK